MRVNQLKTKFRIINRTRNDRLKPLVSQTLRVENCDQYVYLGAFFPKDGKMTTAVRLHQEANQSHMYKFIAFLRRNVEYPFWAKMKVFQYAVMSALMYICESRLSKDLKHLNAPYMAMVKTLLGVRKSTPNDICLTELGLPTVSGRIRATQKRFYTRLITNRSGMRDAPFFHVWTLCK